MRIIKNSLLPLGVFLRKAAKPSLVKTFIDRFRENYVSVKLVRIGGSGDGGYLVPDILNNTRYCFSPGVGSTATFEKQLSRQYGTRCFMADASVSALPEQDDNFEFDKKFLGNRDYGETMTLATWVNSKVKPEENNLLLQMDIEGGEYDVLIESGRDTLRRFQVMVIEFHLLERLFERLSARMLTAIFEKLYQDFSIAHVHPNNCQGIVSANGNHVPRLAEVTFIRKDIISSCACSADIVLPHRLDENNFTPGPGIKMPAAWWKK